MKYRLLAALAGVALATFAQRAEGQIEVPKVLVKLIDQVEVPAREAGVLVSVDVTESSRVTVGALLARVDDTEAQLAEQRAKVELEMARKLALSDTAIRSAEKALKVAQDEYQRAYDANSKFPDLTTKTEIDRLRLAMDQAALAVDKAKQEQAQAALAQQLTQVELVAAERSVERRRIEAPLAGVVVQVFARRGEWVQPGDKILRIVRLDRLRVEGFAAARAVTSQLEGRGVRLLVDLPGKGATAFAGKLVFVGREIDPFNGQVRVIAEIENPTLALQPGLSGTLTIEPPR
jgi:macrolide-specific efflux system membrane fusion protein